jgi:hypothetical protein
MKGAAFVLPLREEFVHSILATYEEFTASCDDAQESLVAWELYDPCAVAKNDNGCFANRGLHLNSLIMPTWTKEENDQQCRQWARDVSNMFKKEIEAHGETASEGIEGGASIRGHKGAVLLYGNYDVSLLELRHVVIGALADLKQQYDEKSRDIFGEHYDRLAQIKAKYDPKNMFDKLFAITPAVSTNGQA